MNLFETVKSAVTVKQAAEYYGCKVNRGDMICCPFHDDRHPSMKLNRDYFYCFGCGATGDVIDFVARLFGLSSYEAAKKLAYDFGIDPDKPPAAMALKKPYPLARAFRNDEIHCQRVLCDYLHLLERWKVEYAPQSPEDELDDRFVEACHMIEYTFEAKLGNNKQNLPQNSSPHWMKSVEGYVLGGYKCASCDIVASS